MTHILNETFEKIVFINLRKRKDRLRECEEEMTKNGFVAERHEAACCRPYNLSLTTGEQGCIVSHRTVLEKARNEGLKNVLILEDDFALVENFDWFFYEFYREVPEDWEMLYLGGNHSTFNPYTIKMAVKISPHVLKLNFTLTTGAYAVKSNIFGLLIDDLFEPKYQVDVHYAFLHNKVKAYGAIPTLIYQRPSFSDIQKREVDYKLEKAIK